MAQSSQEKTKMSLTLLKRSTLPPATRGKGAGIDAVAISDAGQFRLSTTLGKKIGNVTKFATGWLDKTNRVYAICVNEQTIMKSIPKGEKVEDYAGTFSRGKNNDLPPFFSGGLILKADAPEYDYSKAGNQAFQAKYDEKSGVISFVLPAETPSPRPKTGAGRPKGAKNKANGAVKTQGVVGTAAEVGGTAGTPVKQDGDTINLEEAE